MWGRDVLISSLVLPFTGGRGQIISLWAKQRHFLFNCEAERQSPLRQAIMYGYNAQNNRKQRLKSKKQIQHVVRTGSSLLQVNNLCCLLSVHGGACMAGMDWRKDSLQQVILALATSSVIYIIPGIKCNLESPLKTISSKQDRRSSPTGFFSKKRAVSTNPLVTIVSVLVK